MREKTGYFPSARPRAQKIVLLILLPFLLFLLLLAAAKCYAAWIMPYLPPCLLRSVTGFLCPACGMTHSVFALTRLDLITALKENALMPALVLLGLLRYAELWCAVCGRPRTIIPRRAWFWFSFGGAFFLYVLLRNVFL